MNPSWERGGGCFTVLTVVLGNNGNGENSKNGKNGNENDDNNDNNNDNEYSIEVNVGYTVTYTEMEERGLVSSLLENRQFSPVGIAHEPLGGDRVNYIGGNRNTNELVVFFAQIGCWISYRGNLGWNPRSELAFLGRTGTTAELGVRKEATVQRPTPPPTRWA